MMLMFHFGEDAVSSPWNHPVCAPAASLSPPDCQKEVRPPDVASAWGDKLSKVAIARSSPQSKISRRG